MKNPFQVVVRIATGWLQRRWRAGRGFGKPCSGNTWDEQYRAGAWDYLNRLEESDHYGVIAGYVRHSFEQAEILDLGCGHGRLLALLHPNSFGRYTGVDISQEAINLASRLKETRARFITADFEKWTSPDLVDVIVFSESLYYGSDPVAIVRRYLPALKAGGKVIVSMHHGGNHRLIWRNLDSVLRRVHGVQLRADRGAQWTVRIYESPAEAGLAS